MKLATVIMCTFNAGEYLQEQLESIRKQTYPNIELLIYDDRSDDGTVELVEMYKRTHPNFNVQLVINSKNFGAKMNFIHAAKQNINKEYVFFSDQDDIWDLNKIEFMMNRMQIEESNANIPMMVCHNSRVVDKKNNTISYMYINDVDPYSLILHPKIQGCSMLLNNSALKLVDYSIKNVYMHDWYISIIIAFYGRIIVMPNFYINYRQHENNQIGFKRESLKYRILNSFSNNKIQTYKKIILQLNSISIKYKNSFFLEYNSLFYKKKISAIIKQFFHYKIIPKNFKGIYQAMVLYYVLYNMVNENK